MDISSQLFRLNRYLNVLAQESELSIARFEVLRLINLHNPITLRQLCEIQQVSMPTMSKLVDGLQNDSLVIRALSKDDARQRWIVPTQKGIQRYARMSLINQKFWQKKLSHLTPDQQLALKESLQLLNQSLEPKSLD